MKELIAVVSMIIIACLLDYFLSMCLYFMAKRMAREQDYFFCKNGKSWQWGFKLDATKNSKGEPK